VSRTAKAAEARSPGNFDRRPAKNAGLGGFHDNPLEGSWLTTRSPPLTLS
jgi:hypothetical protein